MIIPNRLNPCKSETVGKWWADSIHKIYELLNYGASQCSCCSFFRGAILSGVAGFIVGYLIG